MCRFSAGDEDFIALDTAWINNKWTVSDYLWFNRSKDVFRLHFNGYFQITMIMQIRSVVAGLKRDEAAKDGNNVKRNVWYYPEMSIIECCYSHIVKLLCRILFLKYIKLLTASCIDCKENSNDWKTVHLKNTLYLGKRKSDLSVILKSTMRLQPSIHSQLFCELTLKSASFDNVWHLSLLCY